MGFTNFQQIREVFLCGGVGFLLGAYYDVFRVWRVWFSPRPVSVFLQDVWYCLTSAVVLFVLLLAITDGRGRFYVFLGITVGFFAYRSLFGRCCLRAALSIKRAARRLRQHLIKKHAKNTKKAKKSLESDTAPVV